MVQIHQRLAHMPIFVDALNSEIWTAKVVVPYTLSNDW